MRPPDLFIATPPLAECLAQSTQQAATRRPTGADSLEPFHHLAPGWEPGTTPAAASPEALELVRQDAARLRRLAGQNGYARRLSASTVVYRLEWGGHQQTGVLAEVSVDDYCNGRIRRHEATDPRREALLADFLTAAESELVPVTLVHPTRPGLQALLAEAAAGEPDVRLVSDDGLTQAAWVVHSADLAQAIWEQLEGLGNVYIADGHHRMAAAARHARRGGGTDTGKRAADYVLSALFPSDEMRVLGYHRCVAGAGASAAGLLDELARLPVTERLQECSVTEIPQPAPGVLAVWLDRRWYHLRLRPHGDAVDARAALDVVALEDEVLRPVLEHASSDVRVSFLPGNISNEAFAHWCEQHDAVGFLVHPPTIEQIMAVSDSGAVMPPKSTWFDPKARAGPFIRDISPAADRG
jgi:uncharacterized protein (DUF1015 family)